MFIFVVFGNVLYFQFVVGNRHLKHCIYEKMGPKLLRGFRFVCCALRMLAMCRWV
jgi:hypothetical protein